MKTTPIGHGTFLIEMDDLSILTDPWMTEPVLTHFIHREPIGREIKDLPVLDVILISHNHPDHFDVVTVRKLNKRSLLICKKGMEDRIKKLGFKNIKGLEPGHSIKYKALKISVTHARHPGGAIGFVIEGKQDTIYFAGDTARDERLFRLGEEFDIDLALLPISGNENPSMTTFQLLPTEAAELAAIIDADHVIPSDYGVAVSPRFTADKEERLSVEADVVVKPFLKAMKAQHPKGKAVVLQAGETFELI